MRRPSIADKLSIVKSNGLSSYLSGQAKLDELIQQYKATETDRSFDVLSAGRTPPNPGELLSSERMSKMLNSLRDRYDYIILDFPPVGEVSDAMAVANQIDGMLIVVRQNYCNRIVLGAAIRQFEFIGARMLGVVYNCTAEGGVGYGKGYYRRYYKRYYKRYSKYGYYHHDNHKAEEHKTEEKK
jgi:capsular exopolysaccharide synthesis family protein